MLKRAKSIVMVMIAMMVCVAFLAVTPMEASAASKPAKVTITAVKSIDYNAVKITWKAAKCATKYQVYRATSKNGQYKRIITTSKTFVTNTKLTTGKKYYYKVRAVNGKKTGEFSVIRSAVPKLKKVSGVKATATSYSSCKLSWTKVNGAKKYQIYRAASKSGTYKLVKTVAVAKCEDVKLTQGKTYYYKVRAYRTVNGKKVYSAYSAVKSAYIPIAYKVSTSGETIVENKVFTKDVTIYGNNGIIKFVDCKFKKDLICISKTNTKVMLLGGTTVAGQCILDNGMKEGTLETALPKFITQTSIDVKTVGCYGAVYVIKGDSGYGKITFNGTEYDTSDCKWYIEVEEDGTASLVKYVDQEFTVYGIAQWWENDVKQQKVVCEY